MSTAIERHYDWRHITAAAFLIAVSCVAAPLFSCPTSQDSSVSPAAHYLEEQRTAQELFLANDWAGYAAHLAKMAKECPYKSNLLPRLAAAYVHLGDAEHANQVLAQYAQMGGVLSFQGILKQFRDSGKLAAAANLEGNAKSIQRGQRAFSLSDADLLTEDIAYDVSSRRFLLSSVHKRRILTCTEAGSCETLVENSPEARLLGVLALRLDSKRKILWATSVGMKATSNLAPDDDGKSALLKLTPEGRLLARFEPKDEKKHAFGDMTVAPDGTVYVADGLSGDLYRLRPHARLLELLVPHGTFVSPQTPASSNDGKLLYVPDYTTGIFVIDLNTSRVERVTATVPMALDCIDGLYLSGRDLIAVQNGIQPERIVKFHLRTDRQIDSYRILEANWPGLGDPTHGVVVGRNFYFIVNSGWDRMDDDGKFSAGTPAQVWRLDLSAH